eukprot:6482341-Amphidinium_carterae.1
MELNIHAEVKETLTGKCKDISMYDMSSMCGCFPMDAQGSHYCTSSLSKMAARGRAKVAKDVVVGDLADVLGAHLQGHGTRDVLKVYEATHKLDPPFFIVLWEDSKGEVVNGNGNFGCVEFPLCGLSVMHWALALLSKDNTWKTKPRVDHIEKFLDLVEALSKK